MADKVRTIHRIPEGRIQINPGGVDLKSFYPKQNRRHLKSKINYSPGKIHLLTIRNLDYRMGLDNLLHAIRILKNMQIGVHLIVGGEGPERRNLEDMVRSLDLKQEVTLTGFIPSEDLVNYYSAADFFILPTRELEGFGLVTPESMACGTPVLGTPVGGTKEILSAFNAKFLFKGKSPEAMAHGIKAATDEFFINKEKYQDLRLKCREYVKAHYSWSRHIATLNNICTALVAKVKED